MAEAGMDGYRANRLRELEQQAISLATKNERLAKALQGARDELAAVQEQLDALSRPPSSYATVLSVDIAEREIEVQSSGRRLRAAAAPPLPLGTPRAGPRVRPNAP